MSKKMFEQKMYFIMHMVLQYGGLLLGLAVIASYIFDGSGSIMVDVVNCIGFSMLFAVPVAAMYIVIRRLWIKAVRRGTKEILRKIETEA